jgi:SAM-dependent methyltransferase
MSKTDWQKNTLPEIFKDKWPTDVVSVLDVGCGLSLKSKYIPAQIRVGVDIYPEYFKHIESDVPYVVVKGDARNLLAIFEPKSFDVVIATDIIEHLNKYEALAMIAQCEQIARKAVVLETPLGFIPQDMDITGHGGDEYQTHRSGWVGRDLEAMGYHVQYRDYLMQDVQRHSTEDVLPEIVLMDAIKYV